MILNVVQYTMRMKCVCDHAFSKLKCYVVVLSKGGHVVNVHIHACFAVLVFFGLVPFILAHTLFTKVGVELVWSKSQGESYW
jgi:hypothetical protein